MGCCLGTIKSPEPKKAHFREPELELDDRAPPLEEETVKEVLSETPIPKPPKQPTLIQTKQPQLQPFEVQPMVSSSSKQTLEVEKEIVSEVSQVSEMYSLSESFSTNTVTDKKDDESEVTQRIRRSPVKKGPNSGEIAAGSGNGNERINRSPARRGGRSRSNPGPVMTTPKRVVGSRKDNGEGPARRSRSPVTRGELGPRRDMRYKSPVTTKGTVTGRTGGRSPVRTVECSGSLEKPVADDDVSAEAGESLENPLVSLECFIFL